MKFHGMSSAIWLFGQFRDALEGLIEPGVGIDAVHLGGCQQRGDRGTSASTGRHGCKTRAWTTSTPIVVRFDSATYAVEAAVHGKGVLLGRSALVSADIASGRLVRPFDLALKSRSKYYVVYLASALRQRKVNAFRDWLFDEMAADNEATK